MYSNTGPCSKGQRHRCGYKGRTPVKERGRGQEQQMCHASLQGEGEISGRTSKVRIKTRLDSTHCSSGFPSREHSSAVLPYKFLSSSELHITDLVHIRFTPQRTDKYIGPNWPFQSILRSFYPTVSNQLRITENKGKYRLHKMLPKANDPRKESEQ
jgi:hypothetical protein